jgi:hypothetical protein
MSPEAKIIEVRYFAFSATAVIDALLAAERENGGSLHQLPVVKFAIEQAKEFTVTLSLYNLTKTEQYRFGPEQVAAALIQYCRLRKIPLPRAGKKSLEMKGDNLCLKILLNVSYRPLIDGIAVGAADSAA